MKWIAAVTVLVSLAICGKGSATPVDTEHGNIYWGDLYQAPGSGSWQQVIAYCKSCSQ
jgi:hypothetical protein